MTRTARPQVNDSKEAGCRILNAGPAGGRSSAEVANLLGQAHAGILSSDTVSDAVFDAAVNLRIIARLGVGVDNIHLESADRHGVYVTTTPGLNDDTCADHALALMLASLRRVPQHDISVRSGEWNRGGPLTPWDLHRKRVGVLGYGRIGRAVVRRLEGFATEIRVFDPAADVPAALSMGSLTQLLEWCDVLTLHVPLSPTTRGMIGAGELALMRKEAIIVNTSRGELVDEEALIAALVSGRLRAAALDVFPTEPPMNVGDLQLPNLILSPHIGGLSVEAIQAMAEKCVDQVLQALSGRTPDHCVNQPRSLSQRQPNSVAVDTSRHR